MKSHLTAEQSRKLINLGIPSDNASIRVSGDCGYQHSEVCLFTLADLLNIISELEHSQFVISLKSDKWAVERLTDNGLVPFINCTHELIDELYERIKTILYE